MRYYKFTNEEIEENIRKAKQNVKLENERMLVRRAEELQKIEEEKVKLLNLENMIIQEVKSRANRK